MSGYGSPTFGSAPFGSEGEPGGGPIQADLTSGLAVAGAPANMVLSGNSLTQAVTVGSSVDGYDLPNLVDALQVGGILSYKDLPNLADSIAMNGSAAIFLAAQSGLVDGLKFEDSLQVAWSLLLQEGLQLAGIAAGNPILLGAIVDTMHAIGAAATRIDAVAAISGALALEGLIANGWSLEAIDTIAFNEALNASAAFVAPLVDGAAMSATTEMSMRLLVLAADEAAVDGDTAASMTMAEALSDGLVLYATIRIAGNEYAGWVMNTANAAASEYRNFPFECLQRVGNRYFAGGPGGIYELVGDTDDGQPIEAFIRTGLLNFGTGKMKRVPDVYIARKGNGDVLLKVVTTSESGAKVEDWYRGELKPAGEVREGRIKVGRGLKSVYWQFELCNLGGEALDLADLKLRPLFLDRRV